MFSDAEYPSLELSETAVHCPPSLGLGPSGGGYSLRFCPGPPLAQLEAKLSLETLLPRLRNLRLASKRAEVRHWRERRLPGTDRAARRVRCRAER